MDEVAIRSVRQGDAARILQIYEPYITSTAVTFECEVPSFENFAARVAQIAAQYPYLVAELGGKVVGYAYASRLFERAAYARTCELSVYVDDAVHGKGLGTRLCTELFARLREYDLHSVVSRVALPNPASERLHESLGFTLVGVLHEAGYKFDSWHDVAIYELLLDTDASHT